MKLLSILVILFISSLTFSQNDNFINSNSNLDFLSKEKSKVNNDKVNINTIFPEIILIKNWEHKEVSEGKFLVNSKTKQYFIKINESLTKQPKDKNIHLSANTKQNFIKEVIVKKLNEEILKLSLLEESLTYGDRNIELYRNYEELLNKLIINVDVNEQVTLQIGKNIYPYLNKILKTELDKTLQNSLNLFAVNF